MRFDKYFLPILCLIHLAIVMLYHTDVYDGIDWLSLLCNQYPVKLVFLLKELLQCNSLQHNTYRTMPLKHLIYLDSILKQGCSFFLPLQNALKRSNFYLFQNKQLLCFLGCHWLQLRLYLEHLMPIRNFLFLFVLRLQKNVLENCHLHFLNHQ